jgi:hypothetical protein
MPRPGTRILAGMAAVVALSGCSALQDAAAPAPSATPASSAALTAPRPSPSGAAWAEDLAFSGEMAGRMTGIVPNQPGQTSNCTGPNSKTGGQWASTFFGQVANGVYGLVITANPYRGPGSYPAGPTAIEVYSADLKQVWHSQAGDTVTFVVNNDEQTGTVDAVLTNQGDGKTKLHVTGTWSCRA